MTLQGRASLFGDDDSVITEIASLGKTYVEIGTMFGGSACLAGLAGCEVYCIDPLDGYYAAKHNEPGRVEVKSGLAPSIEIVRSNWAHFGLDQKKLHIYPQMHPPWPEEIKDMRFDSGLIDGDHTYEGARADYLGMGPRVDYLMFHDVSKPGVGMAYREALQDGIWEEYPIDPNLLTLIGVLKRCSL